MLPVYVVCKAAIKIKIRNKTTQHTRVCVCVCAYITSAAYGVTEGLGMTLAEEIEVLVRFSISSL